MRTRFAPSPTGPLHLGHAWAAIVAEDLALSTGGDMLLRIEDIDRSRARPDWEAAIYADLKWMGFSWQEPAMRQSDRMPVYRAALEDLWRRGYLYPCSCSRADIRAALSAPQEGADLIHGPDGLVYPGTCKAHVAHLDGTQTAPMPTNVALRLHMDMAAPMLADPRTGGDVLTFTEDGRGPNGERGEIATTVRHMIDRIGDVVVARPDFGTSYHLSVVVDDAAQGITHVTRGADLFEATPIHVILQRLLHLPTPIYHHHDLVRDTAGKRLAKRDDARAIASYREAGWTAHGLRDHLKHSRVAP